MVNQRWPSNADRETPPRVLPSRTSRLSAATSANERVWFRGLCVGRGGSEKGHGITCM
jgi:hypothetical protein